MTPRLLPLLATAALAAVAATPPAFATSPGAEGRIAFAASDSGPPAAAALFTSNPDGSDRRQIAARGSVARWSADGETLAWYDGETSSIYVGAADGSNARRVVDRVVSAFALSPDGRTLIVARVLRRRDGSRTNWIREDLIRVDVATGRERRLTYDGSNPTFSPDGRTIAFVDLSWRARGSRYRAIDLIGANGKNRRDLYGGSNGSDTRSLDWAPNGRSIAFTQWIGSRTETQLRVIDVRSRRVKTVARDVQGAVWSPTGKRLLTSEWDTRSAYNVVTVRAGGGALEQLGWKGAPVAWQPLPR